MTDAKLPTVRARIVHDLLNPIAAVRGSLSWLEGAIESI